MQQSFDTKKVIIALIASAYFIYYCLTPTTWHFIDTINLIFHEAGHVIFSFFGEFMHILGGSLFQVLFPFVFVGYFYKQRDFFSASLLLFWVGQNLVNVSVYASDSIVMQLPLLGGDGVGHDWNNLLTMTHTLRYTSQIGHTIYILGVIVIMLAINLSIRNARKNI